jgi:hypothetical protein
MLTKKQKENVIQHVGWMTFIATLIIILGLVVAVANSKGF